VSGCSQLVKKLKDVSWIPDKDGVFRKPSEMTKDILRDDFKYEIKANLLDAIGFGEQAVDTDKKHVAQEYFKEQGINADKLEELANILKEHGDVVIEDFRKFAITRKNKEFPSASINKNNLENRRQRVIQELEDESDKESIKIERSIQKDLPDVKVKAKAYLRGK